MRFFGRSAKLQVGDLVLDKLDFEFRARKSLKPEPNTLTLRVYNLTEDHRNAMQTAAKNVVKLEVGYGDDLVQIFLGEVRAAYSVFEQDEWVTTLETGDSEKKIAMSGINVSFGSKTPVTDVLRSAAKALGVGGGNLEFALAKLGTKLETLTIFGKRGILTGTAANAMTMACDSAGLEWSVQDGEMLLLQKGQALDGVGALLSKDTGLIGSPAIEARGKPGKDAHLLSAKDLGGHLVTATTLLHPGLRCGGKVQFDSVHVKGPYRIEEIQYSGNRTGREWYCTLKASPVMQFV